MLQVNRRFNKVASEDLLWHALLSSEVGQANLPRFTGAKGSWRRRFLQWQRLDSCGCEEQLPSLVDGGSSPQARFLHRAACLSDRWLYVFGGQGQDGEFNDLWVLDKERALSSGGWRHLHPVGIAPEQRQSATLTTIGTQLLMFGGRQGETTFMNDTWLFDTATCRWTCVYESEESPMMVQAAGSVGQRPCPRWAHSAVRIGGRILVFGGSAAWSRSARPARLLRAWRLRAAWHSQGGGGPTGRPATAPYARASRLLRRPLHRLAPSRQRAGALLQRPALVRPVHDVLGAAAQRDQVARAAQRALRVRGGRDHVHLRRQHHQVLLQRPVGVPRAQCHLEADQDHGRAAPVHTLGTGHESAALTASRLGSPMGWVGGARRTGPPAKQATTQARSTAQASRRPGASGTPSRRWERGCSC